MFRNMIVNQRCDRDLLRILQEEEMEIQAHLCNGATGCVRQLVRWPSPRG